MPYANQILHSLIHLVLERWQLNKAQEEQLARAQEVNSEAGLRAMSSFAYCISPEARLLGIGLWKGALPTLRGYAAKAREYKLLWLTTD